jgi:hypothetical protein|mmetsp:Transcript_2542/g.9826  ORF Transcript_2542/g.9826 Transcript_2542/m.9826 type:complete len:142 (+) Transcript_2542:601-1026(+)
MQNPFFNVMASFGAATHDTGGVQFWDAPDRSGWLMKQGDVIKTWRSRFFVLKDGKLFWFSGEDVTSSSTTRGVIDVRKCLSVKGAEDVLNRQFGFELSSKTDTVYFVANSAKEKEEWINALGKAVVKHSLSMMQDYPDDAY